MKSRLGIAVTLTVLTTALGASTALASGGGTIEVAQPIVAYEYIQVSRVTFAMGRPHQHIPGYELRHLGTPSCVCDDRGESANRNAASFLGMKAGYHPHHSTGSLFGDTLRVYLDLSELRPAGPELEGVSVDAAIRAAVECVLTTAYDSRFGIVDSPDVRRVPAKHVWLEVRGSDEYSHLGGVFSFEELGQLPRERFFR